MTEDNRPPGSQKRESLAEKAIEKADAKSLGRLYKEAEKDVETLANGLAVLCKMEKTGPLPPPNDTLIESMRDVALAAIQLARDVAIPNKES